MKTVCAACLAATSAARPMALKEFLDLLPEPVLCTGGDVLACEWARLEGGRGKTVQCAACALRRTVSGVHAPGRAVLRAPAWLERGPADGGERLELLVSAEKAGDVVLLRLDRMDGTAG
jgi:hypothetical protein